MNGMNVLKFAGAASLVGVGFGSLLFGLFILEGGFGFTSLTFYQAGGLYLLLGITGIAVMASGCVVCESILRCRGLAK